MISHTSPKLKIKPEKAVEKEIIYPTLIFGVHVYFRVV